MSSKEVTHSNGAFIKSLTSSDLGTRVSTVGAEGLLLVEGDLSASAAPSVGLGMSLTERLCSLCLLVQDERRINSQVQKVRG